VPRGESPRRSGRHGIALILAVLFIGTVLFRVFATGGAAVVQPIAFNHLKHTRDLQLTCEFCHEYVRDGAHAGLPGAETCSVCHRVPQGTSEEAARVTELLSDGDPLRFNKLFRLRDDVYFTHRRHVALGGLECQSCHGDIAEMERPPTRPIIIPSKRSDRMGFCLDCHREVGESLDCNACHR